MLDVAATGIAVNPENPIKNHAIPRRKIQANLHEHTHTVIYLLKISYIYIGRMDKLGATGVLSGQSKIRA